MDLYLQKPISVDVVEGQAMLAAARKYGRVVQVGTQRRSTPHIVEARDQVVRAGRLGKIALVEIYCYYHMRTRENPPDTAPPESLDWEAYTGPAPLRPYNQLVHPRGWRAFMEYGNGIVGDMCIHMLDTVRFLMDLGMPRRISSSGGILVDKASKANITDTQSATFDYGDLQVVWTHRTWGDPPDPKYPWGLTLYGEKGTLKASVMSYDFLPREGGGPAVHQDVTYELEQFPEDKTEKDLERHVAPAIRGHMKDLLACMKTRGRPVADIEEGYVSTTACILANLSDAARPQPGMGPREGPRGGRRRGESPAAAALPRALRAPRPGHDLRKTPWNCRSGRSGRAASRSRRSGSGRGRREAGPGRSAGARRTTATPSRPSFTRCRAASTGSTPRRSTAWATPRWWWAGPFAELHGGRAAPGLHQVRDAVGREGPHGQAAADLRSRFHPGGVRGLPEATGGGGHRPHAVPLARRVRPRRGGLLGRAS